MASQLKVDTITGVTTAGSIAVTAEGNSTTTNLQQGLAKAWTHFQGTSTAASVDGLNISSVDDDGTGDYGLHFTNNMGNNKFSATTTGHWKGHTTGGELNLSRFVGACNFSTGAYSFGSQYSNGNAQDNYICTNVSGDLA